MALSGSRWFTDAEDLFGVSLARPRASVAE